MTVPSANTFLTYYDSLRCLHTVCARYCICISSNMTWLPFSIFSIGLHINEPSRLVPTGSVIDNDCSAIHTDSSVVNTDCSVIDTDCFAINSDCSIIDTDCSVIVTDFSAIDTDCLHSVCVKFVFCFAVQLCCSAGPPVGCRGPL